MPDPKRTIGFGPFRADLDAQCLWRAGAAVSLRPKTWDVLRYLLERPGQLVTKDELLDQVWAGTIVSEGTLTQSIRELRSALDDDSKQPRFIATVHRRGYRFIAELATSGVAKMANGSAPRSTHLLVGREKELRRIHDAVSATLQGRRATVFVTGEAGIGKTALLDEVMRTAEEHCGRELTIARGQCVEQRCEAEPYLPVLDALHHLCGKPDGMRVVDVLTRYAPTWLVQMPWLLPPDKVEVLRGQLVGTGSERMLREFAIAMDVLARQVPLVMVLEDLHWSDLATVDLLAALARRRDPAPFLLIGSSRSMTRDGHPLDELLRTLTTRSDAIEIALGALSPDAARTFVMHRLDNQAPQILVDVIQHHSGGSPLFLVTALTYAVAEGWIVRSDDEWQLAVDPALIETLLPAGLRQLIEVQMAGLEQADRDLLEAASIAGMAFGTGSLGVAIRRPTEETEAVLASLCRRFRFLRRLPTSDSNTPDPARFEFTHALYQQVLYAGTAAATRRRLHLEVARGLLLEHGDRASQFAAELALHFERGGAFEEASRYLGQAALNAHTRVANREAALLIENAIRLIAQVEDSTRRQRREVDLWIQLGAVRGSIYGRGAEQYIAPYLKAWELSRALDDVPRMFLARMAMFGHFGLTQQYGRAEEVCRDLLVLSRRAPMPDIVAVANAAMGSVLGGMGRLQEARQHLELALATLNPHDPSTQLFRRLEDPEILCLTGLAWTLAQLGFPDQARQRCIAAIELGRSRAPYHHVYGLNAAAILNMFLDAPESCLEHAQHTLELAREHGFDGFLENASVLATWAQQRMAPASGAWHNLQAEVDAYRSCNQRFGLIAYQALVAEACLRDGAIASGLTIIAAAEAMMESSAEHAPAGNLLRIKAQLLDVSGAEQDEVEQCLQAAVSAARHHGSKLYELRAATVLAEWWMERDEHHRARDFLQPIYRQFTEGFDVPDMQRAQILLRRLSSIHQYRGPE